MAGLRVPPRRVAAGGAFDADGLQRRNSGRGCSSSGRTAGRCEAVVANSEGSSAGAPNNGGEDNSRREVLLMAEMLQRLSERIDRANEVSRQLKTDILSMEDEDDGLAASPSSSVKVATQAPAAPPLLGPPPPTTMAPGSVTQPGVLSLATRVDSIEPPPVTRPAYLDTPQSGFTSGPLPPFQSAGYGPPPINIPPYGRPQPVGGVADLPYPIAPPAPLPEEVAEAVESMNDVNTVRRTLSKKLSDANMLTRKLEREAKQMDSVVKEAKEQLQLVLSELDDLQWLAEEIGKSVGQGKAPYQVNGKPAHELLIDKARTLKEAVLIQMRRVDSVDWRVVEITWNGMAEDVMVMGSFDDWTRGEQMSPEIEGTETVFRCTIRLRPGRYLIKFVVDGIWRTAPEWPETGEGLEANNVLLVT